MKICVYFKPNKKSEIFEGVRLAKNIKGALTLHDIPYTKNLNDSYDIVHFVSLDDESNIIEAKERGIPVVFSALYCEADETAKILVDGQLTSKAKRVLNRCDVVLVSDELSRKLLIEQGVTSLVEIVTPGVNKSRFKFSESIEENIFFDYVQLSPESKFVTFIGSQKNKNQIKMMVELAKKCPKVKFFFLGARKMHIAKRIINAVPKNLRFYPLLSNDLYCSMMKKASAFLALDNSIHAPVTLLEATGSKTPIVALEPLNMNQEMLSNVDAYIACNIDEVAKHINSIVEGNEIPSEKAYLYAKNNSLFELGEELIEVYKNLLDGR